MAAATIQLVGYAAEMQRIESEIRALGEEALAPPLDTERATKYLSYLYLRASLSGDLEGLAPIGAAIDRTIPQLPNPCDLYLLKANLAFKVHRLDLVKEALEASPYAYHCQEGVSLRADLDFQQGRYAGAKSGYEAALAIEQRWDTLARLAHYTAKLEDADAADQIYEEAEDELTAKEMRSYCWLEVQRGLLDFFAGKYAEARCHYTQASAAYPGYWFVDEHTAELLGAEGRFVESAALFEQVVTVAPKPEFYQSLGEIYALMDQRERAQYWNGKALAAYHGSTARGEVHYYHHLADYYCDVAEEGAPAVHWARQDVALRQNFATQTALAWALYRDGQFEQAREWIEGALASGVVEARPLYLAAQIYAAVGRTVEGDRFMERARRLNPGVGGFHLHH